MEINLVELLVTAALAAAGMYGLWRLELYIRLKLYLRSRKPGSPSASPITTRGTVTGSRDAVICTRCGGSFRNFVEYSDGDKWCLLCDATFDE